MSTHKIAVLFHSAQIFAHSEPLCVLFTLPRNQSAMCMGACTVYILCSCQIWLWCFGKSHTKKEIKILVICKLKFELILPGTCLLWFVLGKDALDRATDEPWLRTTFSTTDFDRKFAFVTLVGNSSSSNL